MSPNFLLSLKTGGQGVGHRHEDGAGGNCLPSYVLDSRFRGNDNRECRDRSLPRVWGCPPIPEFSPKTGGQGVDNLYAGLLKCNREN